MSASRSQQTNGAVERIIAVVEEIFRTRIDFRQQPDSQIADQEYEISKIMAHPKRYGRNEFLVHYKGFSELRGEYTEEAN